MCAGIDFCSLSTLLSLQLGLMIPRRVPLLWLFVSLLVRASAQHTPQWSHPSLSFLYSPWDALCSIFITTSWTLPWSFFPLFVNLVKLSGHCYGVDVEDTATIAFVGVCFELMSSNLNQNLIFQWSVVKCYRHVLSSCCRYDDRFLISFTDDH